MRHGAGLFKIGPASRLRNVSADNSRLICMYVISYATGCTAICCTATGCVATGCTAIGCTAIYCTATYCTATSDVAKNLCQSRQMNEFACFCPKNPIPAQFGYNLSGQTDSGAGNACFCHILVTSLIATSCTEQVVPPQADIAPPPTTAPFKISSKQEVF